MDKKTDRPPILASPPSSGGVGGRTASTSGPLVAGRRPYVPGAILRQASAAATEPSPAAANPLPPGWWPPVDEYLDEPDEVSRWERIGGVRKEAVPADSGHGDPHFKLDALVDAHMAEGYTGSTDLKTRVDAEREHASDTCVRREGIDPATGRRYLEELVFEVVHKRSKQETDDRARAFAARGVRRQVGIFVKKKELREWVPEKDDWGEPLELRRTLRDPCLAVALPLAALLHPDRAKVAIARALEAKKDPTIVEMKKKSEKRGRAQGKAEGIVEGEKRGRAQGKAEGIVESVLTVLGERGLDPSDEVRERIGATTDVETLERWLRRALSASSLDDVLDELPRADH